jgi:small subunit ribosomal protein S4
MARYTGPKSKIARRFREAIFGRDKALEKKNYGPGQHGNSRRRPKLSEYAIQLAEKQKAKYTYGVLEKQFRNTFKRAAAKKGITGENLLKFLEARLDNTVYRMSIAPTRRGARQLVSHRHITVNGEILNIPSYSCMPGDVISLKNKSAANTAITGNVRGKNPKFSWIDWSESEMKGTFITYPERESVPENIKEQLIVELYSK